VRSDAKCLAIPVEAEGSGSLDEFEPRLGVTKKEHFSRALGAPINHVQSIRADPLDTDNLDHRGTDDPLEFPKDWH
jgi:hypothetical protein